MEWMGHEDIRTTQLYMKFKPKHHAAHRLSAAFEDGAGEKAATEPVET